MGGQGSGEPVPGDGAGLVLRRRCCGTAGRHRAPGGVPGPAPGWDTAAHPASKAAHCPLMLPPGSGAGKSPPRVPAEGSPAAPCREKRGMFSVPQRSGAWFGEAPRGQQRCQTLNPYPAALQRSCRGAFCTYST